MCGIAGIINARMDTPAREAAVRRMADRQRHRGPDETGIYSSAPVTIGMCRLAIFDPANGHQPMETTDGRFNLVFNGAIYNYRELWAELAALGWSFRTNCDTEVLLAAFAHYGEACLPRLRGMFAFAVWDRQERTLFIARDSVGIKPVYYSQQPGSVFVFASEINGLLASGLVQADIDPAAVGDYLAWLAVPAPRTIYRGVANLPPGHCLKVDAAGSCLVYAWWQIPGPQYALAHALNTLPR